MSEEKFKQAKTGLQFSQSIVDKLRGEQMAQQSPEMAMGGEEVPMAEEEAIEEVPEETPMEEPEEQKNLVQGVVEGVKETIMPMFESLKEAFTAKEEDPKEVEIKIDGEMKPKEEK